MAVRLLSLGMLNHASVVITRYASVESLFLYS